MHAKHDEEIISNHNKAIMTKVNRTGYASSNCNCCIKNTCPINKQHQISGVVYQETVKGRKTRMKLHHDVGLNDNMLKIR